MKPVLPFLLLSLASSLAARAMASPPEAVPQRSLAGQWRFALDRADVGVKAAWFKRNLPEPIYLPGVLQAQSYGDVISTNTPWVLSLYDRLWYLRADYQRVRSSSSDVDEGGPVALPPNKPAQGK